MASVMLESLAAAYQSVTVPLPVLGVPLVDLVGALRLSVAMRQLRALKARAAGVSPASTERSLLQNIWTTYVVVWGGEGILCALLAHTPSFLASPVYPLLFAASDALVLLSPVEPPIPSLATELPLAVVDAFTRVGLLTAFALPPVLGHPSQAVAESPLALLLTATVLANGGFFIVSSASMLEPDGWKIATPPELKPWGWTSMDLWSAGVVTGLFALMTRPQPWWGQVVDAVVGGKGGEPLEPVDVATARTICLAILIGLFSMRALWNFGQPPAKSKTD